MREIIIYEAFDGEQFLNKKVCEEHEDRFRRISDYIRFYDADMNEIPVSPLDDNDQNQGSVMKAYNTAEYIRIVPTDGYKRAVKFFADLYYGFCIGDGSKDYEAGLYKYDEDGGFLKTADCI